jgi:hypothetical protein
MSVSVPSTEVLGYSQMSLRDIARGTGPHEFCKYLTCFTYRLPAAT